MWKADRNAFNGPVIPFGAMVEDHPISAKDLTRLHQFGAKVLPGICLHFPIAGNARSDEIFEGFRRISRCGIKLQWKIVSRFQSTCNDSEFSVHAEPTSECLWIHGIHLDYRKTFLVINFLRLIKPEIILKEFNLMTCKENVEWSLEMEGQRLFAQVMTGKIKAQFQCRHSQEGRCPWVLQYHWNYCRIFWSDSKDSKYRNCNSTNSIVHNHFWCGEYDSKIKWLSVLIFHRKPSYGSRKWRWSIQWTNENPRDRFQERTFQILTCWTRILLLFWIRSSRTPTSRRRSVSRNRKPRKRTGFSEEDRSPS